MAINGIPIGEIIDEIKKEGEKNDGFSFENLDQYLGNLNENNMKENNYSGEEIKKYIYEKKLSREDIENAYFGALLDEKEIYSNGDKKIEGLATIISNEINENKVAINKVVNIIKSIDYKNDNPEVRTDNKSNVEKIIKDLNLPINQVEIINKFLNREVLGDLQINRFGNELFNKIYSISNEEENFIKELEDELDEYISIKNVGEKLGKKVPNIEFTLLT